MRQIVRWSAPLALAGFLLSGLSSCTFFSIPERRAQEAVNEHLDGLNWDRAPRLMSAPLPTLREIAESAKPPKPIGKQNTDLEGTPIGEFLHISDAQIRDESMYVNSPKDLLFLNQFDPWVNVTVRRSIVERYDALVLATFLHGYASAKETGLPRFIVHTGDLLDISLVSEVMEAMNILRHVDEKRSGVPVYSVAGNHDGMTFGNILDLHSDTRGLGINKAEFVFAHLLTDSSLSRHGFGFGHNELLSSTGCRELRLLDARMLDAADEQRWKSYAEFCKKAHEQRDKIKLLRLNLPAYLDNPASYRHAVDFSGTLDQSDLRLGYYSWETGGTGAPHGFAGVRYLALDGRSTDNFLGVLETNGFIGDVQLGWVFEQLEEARKSRQAVVVFSHYSLRSMGATLCAVPAISSRGRNGCALAKMLRSFPNVVAYVYGHGHENQVSPKHDSEGRPPEAGHSLIEIQTGSIADFPQVGRLTKVHVLPGEGSGEFVVRLGWTFVRPDAGANKKTGANLEALIKASRKDAEKEYRSGRFHGWKIGVRRYLAPLLMHPFEQAPHWTGWDDWKREHLAPGWRTKIVRFDWPDGQAPQKLSDFVRAKQAKRIEVIRQELGLPPATPVEFKFPLKVEKLSDERAWKKFRRAFKRGEAKKLLVGLDWDDKRCRSVDFFDNPSRTLRRSNLLVRRRVKRATKPGCFLVDGSLAPADEESDLTLKRRLLKGAFDALDEGDALEGVWRGPGTAETELNIIVARDGRLETIDEAIKAEGGATDFSSLEQVLSIVRVPTADAVTPICSAAQPIEQIKWEGKARLDGSRPLKLDFIIWRHRGEVIAAEVSFDGSLSDAESAETIRDFLAYLGYLSPDPYSKTDRAYEACSSP